MPKGVLEFVLALVERGVLLLLTVLVKGSSKQVLEDEVIIFLLLLLGREFLLIQPEVCRLFIKEFLSSDGSFLFQPAPQDILNSVLVLLFALLFLLRLGVILHVDAVEVVIQGVDHVRLMHAFLPAFLVETAHVEGFYRFCLLYLL